MKTSPADILLWKTKSVGFILALNGCRVKISPVEDFENMFWCNKKYFEEILQNVDYRMYHWLLCCNLLPAVMFTDMLFICWDLSVPAWCYCCSGFSGHSGFLHCLTDGEESDWDQPLPAGYHGRRSCWLQLLGAPAGPPVSHLWASEQGAHLCGSSFQAAC